MNLSNKRKGKKDFDKKTKSCRQDALKRSNAWTEIEIRSFFEGIKNSCTWFEAAKTVKNRTKNAVKSFGAKFNKQIPGILSENPTHPDALAFLEFLERTRKKK